VYVSLENDPLLFVQGPPVYRHIKKVSLWQEESTSIFPEPSTKDFEEDKQVPKGQNNVETTLEVEAEKMDNAGKPAEADIETDPVMWKRLRFLSTEFAQYVYKPLRFQLHSGEQILGSVNELYPSSVEIKGPNDAIVAVEIQEIQEIWWGGKILPVRF